MNDSVRLMIAARLRPATATSCVDDARTASSTTRPPVWSSMAGPTAAARVEQHARYSQFAADQQADRRRRQAALDNHPAGADWCPPHGIPRPDGGDAA